MWRLSCSLAFCCVIAGAFGQQPPPTPPPLDESDTTEAAYREKKPDSLRQKFALRSFRFGVDLLSVYRDAKVPTFKGWEVNGDIDLGKFYLSGDVGNWGRVYDVVGGGTYENSGSYWRAGLDLNLLKKDPDRNMFFLGFRYGRATFREASTFSVSDPYFGDIQKTLQNETATAGWGELVTGLRVKIWKGFWMGYTGRMKFSPKVTGDTELKTYDIPGYGLFSRSIYWGFNYQVFWRIPFKREKPKKPLVPLKQ